MINSESEELPVLATAAMIALMENAAYKSVALYLEEGQGTVGTLMNVKHLAATGWDGYISGNKTGRERQRSACI